ncbi:hypothetical protein [Actinomadura nitritigenes]
MGDRPVHAAVQGGHLVIPADAGLQVVEQVPGVDGPGGAGAISL